MAAKYFLPAYKIIIFFDNTKTPKHIGTIINSNEEIELLIFLHKLFVFILFNK